MSRIDEFGMMDAASRPKRRWPILSLISALAVVLVYVGIRNYAFIQAGMLNPNFGQIHRAYDFNLWELPWTLFALGLLTGVASLLRRELVWLAGLFVFLAVALFALR